MAFLLDFGRFVGSILEAFFGSFPDRRQVWKMSSWYIIYDIKEVDKPCEYNYESVLVFRLYVLNVLIFRLYVLNVFNLSIMYGNLGSFFLSF